MLYLCLKHLTDRIGAAFAGLLPRQAMPMVLIPVAVSGRAPMLRRNPARLPHQDF